MKFGYRPGSVAFNFLWTAFTARVRRADVLRKGRGDAAAATWIFRGDESRCDVEVWSRPRRGNLVGTMHTPQAAVRAAVDTGSARTIIELGRVAASQQPTENTLEFAISVVDVVLWLAIWRASYARQF